MFKKLKIMVVDDSNVVRSKITRALESGPFDIVARAGNGKEAVEMYKNNRPDVVTMDLTMPEMDGLQAIRLIINADPEAHILVVSALSDKATGIKALHLGAQGFVLKPFTNEQLYEALIEITGHEHEHEHGAQ